MALTSRQVRPTSEIALTATLICFDASGETEFVSTDRVAGVIELQARERVLAVARSAVDQLQRAGLSYLSQLDVDRPRWLESIAGEDDTSTGVSTVHVESRSVAFQRYLNGLPVFGNGVIVEVDNLLAVIGIRVA